MRRLILTIVMVLPIIFWQCSTGPELPEVDIVPRPMQVETDTGYFEVTPETEILFERGNTDVRAVAEYLADLIQPATGFSLSMRPISGFFAGKNVIILTTKDSGSARGTEGYAMQADSNVVIIRALSATGIFYGVQTLRQLLPVEIEQKSPVKDVHWTIPAVTIADHPRFKWRGMHLDVCRHFFPVSFIKKYIDVMAMYKLNTFHWHLTDDQGWRIEIKKYPRLTSVGANRSESQGDGMPHAGYYTQDEVRDVVAYAASRFITVVPEIEMPGHSKAALAAYPELSCTGGPFDVETHWGIFPDVFCAGSEKMFEFMENVLLEVMDLFPGEVIHIGGDECPKVRWEKCPECQQRIADENLANEHELQSYFITRIEKFVNAHGRHIIGWDEILEGGLAPNAAVMSWRGMQGGIEAANAGHNVVMAPTSFCYFDYYQAKSGEPKAIGGYLPLEKAYSFEPVPAEIDPEKEHFIIGAQANLWTEYIPTPEHAEYMLLPRMCALAEVVWSPKELRYWPDFKNRMEIQYQRLAKLGVNFRLPTPDALGETQVLFKPGKVSIENPLKIGTLVYTLDGSEPVATSTPYTGPILISGDCLLKVRTLLPGGHLSRTVETAYLFADKDLNGVSFSYYEGKWKSLPDFTELTPVETGISYSLRLSDLPARDDFFAAQYRGKLHIENAGEYTFTLISDDGSRFGINDSVFIDHDGLHGSAIEKNATVSLVPGDHPFNVDYFEYSGGENLAVFIEGPDMPRQLIPIRILYRP